ncbi:MAG TPA: hypothetical protein VMD09_10635 [Solirubrobacteraceae bacterium]|nr:hypothetical protein [Solirubrobacteraceae bacterium]
MSPEEFRALLVSKGVPAACPVCGAEDWRGLDDIVDLPVRVAGATSHETHVRIPGFEALAPSCGRCGHVRLIDLRWVQARLPPAAEAPPAPAPPPDPEPPDPGRSKRGRLSGQAVTDIWGQPISKRRGKKP